MTDQAGKSSLEPRNVPSAISSAARFNGVVSSFAAGSGSGFASGSCGGGYGLGLIAADEGSQRRIRAIMRDLCAKDAAGRKEIGGAKGSGKR